MADATSQPAPSHVSLRDRFILYVENRSSRNFPIHVKAVNALPLLAVRLTTAFLIDFGVAVDKVWKWLISFLHDEPSPRPPSPIKPGDCWARVNHSQPNLDWSEVVDPHILKSIRRVLRRWRKSRWINWYGIDQLNQDNSTRNFRIVPGIFSDPFLLRLHVGVTAQRDIRINHKIRQWLLTQKIFHESPMAHCITPIASKSGVTYLPVDFTLDSRATACFAECMPYAHGVSHYEAPSEPQIRSFARLLGSLQSALQGLDDALRPRLSQEEIEIFRWDPNAIKNDLLHVSSHCAISRKRQARPLVSLWLANEQLINSSFENCRSGLADRNDKVLRLLHDVHPHNTFFIDDTCVLIFDYAWITDWSHSDVLAFSVHRFVREWVRQSIEKGQVDAAQEVHERISEFIASYKETGPPVPDDFQRTLHLLIAAQALVKLRYCMLCGLDLWPDRFSRSPLALMQECEKFVTFLNEAKYFAPKAH